MDLKWHGGLVRRKDADKEMDFRTVTNMAAEAWKSVEPEVKEKYEALAACEKDAYEAALKVYTQHKEQRLAEEAQRRAASEVLPHFNPTVSPLLANWLAWSRD